jgi:hypothetical protein
VTRVTRGLWAKTGQVDNLMKVVVRPAAHMRRRNLRLTPRLSRLAPRARQPKPRQLAAGAGAFAGVLAAGFAGAAGLVMVVPEASPVLVLDDSALWSAVRLALPEPDRESVR